jgi:hypothetical protein
MKRWNRATAGVAIAVELLSGVVAVQAQNAAVKIKVNAAVDQHAINPNIYGVAYATTEELNDLNTPLNRNGGNNTSRYNWLQNADNRAQDWYFESIGDTSAVAGERGDTFIADAKAANAEAMLTVPLLDWVAKLGTNRSKLASFSLAKYGPQTGNDSQWFPDAGNGIWTSGNHVFGNDPNDANVPSSSAFQQAWVQHLISQWGTNASGGLRYYILDNEPSIWHSTHRDVQPTGITMDQMLAKTLDYAAMIKNNDASALVVGPEEWGWSGYFYSGYDQQYGSLHGWGYLPDRVAHGNADYLPWLLTQLHQNELNSGRRLIDIFTVHYYPQGGEFSDDVSKAMQLRRNRSTRSLWDPNYRDETWINDYVQLIPRLKSWVSSYYPGTFTGITEYNWGAEWHINGATTQADIYGIFGRENVDLAARWSTPDPTTPTYKAMKMYRNYDGARSTFGDTSVQTTVPNPDRLSAFSAVRSSDGALTIMVIAKVSGSTPVKINVANYTHASTAQAWQLTSANAITRLSDVSFAGNVLSATVPAQSVTLFVVPAASLAPMPMFAANTSKLRPRTAATTTATTSAPTKPPAGSTPIDLTWIDNSTTEDGFKVERCTGAGCTNFTQIATVSTNVTTYADTGVTRNTIYRYRVRAYKGTTSSAYSNIVRAKAPTH